MRPFHIIVLAILVGGCCPVGCDEEALLLPGGTITVNDSAGEPVSDATLHVLRFVKHPHFQPRDTWQFKSGADGHVIVTHEVGEETQYPLMMHGIASFAWQVCAEKGNQRVTGFWTTDYDFPPNTPIDQRRKDLELTLSPSEVSCEESMKNELRSLD